MLVEVYKSAVFDLEATTISVEERVDSGNMFHLLGYLDIALIKNSFRIAAALKNKGRSFPGEKSTVMAPADLHKEGSASDLPLAVGLLVASDQIETGNFQIFFNRNTFPQSITGCSDQGSNMYFVMHSRMSCNAKARIMLLWSRFSVDARESYWKLPVCAPLCA